MSKLYNTYEKLKKENPEKRYMFKSGMFYIFLEDDAKAISEIFGFKITKLNENVVKCGFPISRLEFYTEQFKNRDINFQIVDGNYAKIDNYSDYLNNEKVKSILKKIKDCDLNNISFKQAFELLEEIQEKLSNI